MRQTKGAQWPPNRTLRHSRTLTAIRIAGLPLLVLLCYAASVLAAFATARQNPQNSDTVQSILAANSLLHGNLLLSGWHLAGDNFFFTDTLPFAAFIRLLGKNNAALTIVPAFTYALIVAVSLAASLRSLRWGLSNLAALAMVVLLLGLPPLGLSYTPLLSPVAHGGSCLFALTGLMLFAALAKAGHIRDRPFLVLVLAAITFAAVASDPFTIVFAFAPALLVLGVGLLAGQNIRRAAYLLVVLGLPCVLGGITPLAIAYLGGFVTEWSFVRTEFVEPDHLSSTLAGFVFGFLYISGAYIFGKQALAAGTVANAARLVGWLLGSVAVAKRFRCLRKTGPEGLFDRFLLTSFAVVAAACIFSGMFYTAVRTNVFVGGAGTRYIAPLVVFGTVLAARAVSNMIDSLPTQRLRLLTAGVLAALAGGLLIAHTRAAAVIAASPSWVARSEFSSVAQWLEARLLTCGVGDYWSASIVTAITGGEVTVRALIARPDNRLQPYRWLADDHWYGGTNPPSFVIWQANGPYVWSNVDQTSVAVSYGPPERVEHFGKFTIAILPPYPTESGPAVRCP